MTERSTDDEFKEFLTRKKIDTTSLNKSQKEKLFNAEE